MPAIDRDTMENLAPPAAIHVPGSPRIAGSKDFARLRDLDLAVRAIKSPATIAAAYTGTCACGRAYANNCAHAFIASGFTELAEPLNLINARCDRKRPIRARELRAWFDTIATVKSRSLNRNTGWWAAFQLDESAYWGGHVCIVDSNEWVAYGTGFYPQLGPIFVPLVAFLAS
jgi:hypothetical protein